jgi:hypothetical protein
LETPWKKTTTNSMEKNKAPRPNGMVVEFYIFF